MDPAKLAKLEEFDFQQHLKTPQDRVLYLKVVLEDGDPQLIASALGDIARAEGMSKVARRAGVTREALYKALSSNGDPKISTLFGVLKALDLQLDVKPVDETVSDLVPS